MLLFRLTTLLMYNYISLLCTLVLEKTAHTIFKGNV